MKERKIGNNSIEDINVSLIICGVFSLIFLGYLFYLIFQTEYKLIPYLTIPLIVGLVIENKRLKTDWKMLKLKIMISFILASSVFAIMFLDSINIAGRIENWPYIFIFFFALISAIYHDKKVTYKITEGVTLLQSISIIYWIINSDYLGFSNIFESIILVIGLIFSLISFQNAFTYKPLNTRIRLFLSLWSSIIMMIFSLIYIYRVYHFDNFTGDYVTDYLINVVQYFLLGISLIYIIQNVRMLVVYLPSKHSFFDKEHLKRIAVMNKLHVWRYSKEQANIKDSILILLLTTIIYFTNYIFNFIPSLTLIWIVFWFAPIVIFVKDKMLEKKLQPTSVKLK